MISYLERKDKKNISIDSLKVRIPYGEVKVINEAVCSKWLRVNEKTGEVDPDYFKKKSLRKSENGITVHFGVEKQMTADATVRKYLTILLPSKALKEYYFGGITHNNIKRVYDYLMELQVVEFSCNTFLHGSACTDVDFKKDVKNSDIGDIIALMSANARESKLKNVGYKSYNTHENQGIEFSDRRTTRFKSNPFFKVYNKQKELDNNSKEFSGNYLNGASYNGIIRVETTVKNKKHFKSFGVHDTSLNGVLSISNKIKEEILGRALKSHLWPRKRLKMAKNELNPCESVFLWAIKFALDRGMSYDHIRKDSVSGIKSRHSRSRLEKKFDELYQQFLRGKKEDKKALNLSSFCDEIGWI